MPRRKRGFRTRKTFHETRGTHLNGRAFSGLTDADRWVIRAEKLGKMNISVFYAPFAAQAFLDLLIGEDEIKWKADDRIKTSSGVIIRGEQLKEIYKYHPTTKEDDWELPQKFYDYATYIRSDEEYKPELTMDRRERHSRKGMVLIHTIAEEFKLEPRDARGILRRHMKKPAHGWAWRTSEEIESIKKLLRESLQD